MKLGQKVTVFSPQGNYTAKIVGKVKFENPFSAFRKKGTNYIVEKDNGERCEIDPARIIS